MNAKNAHEQPHDHSKQDTATHGENKEVDSVIFEISGWIIVYKEGVYKRKGAKRV